jgi:hypothetical protein
MNKARIFIIIILLAAVAFLLYVFLPNLTSLKYSTSNANTVATAKEKGSVESETVTAKEEIVVPPPIVVTHIKTPDIVKGIYVSGWVAGNTKLMNNIISMVDTTELNSIVIDVQDSTGKISFAVYDPEVSKYEASENRIANVRKLLADLHAKDIYVIGRIAVFQDPYMTKLKPEWAIKKISDGTVWKDRKGLSFLDPSNKNVWDYKLALAKEAYAAGFDEINFDYIRFPSDGDMKNIAYPNAGEGVTRADIVKSFFAHLHEQLKDTGIKTSADLFGLVTTATDDLGIGQKLEYALPYFDYICPMVYPSHFAKGTYNIANPAANPHDIIKESMGKAVERAKAMGEDPNKLRPWLQDFDLGAKYTPEMVRAQITATNEVGLSSWLLWDAGNTYTKSALKAE